MKKQNGFMVIELIIVIIILLIGVGVLLHSSRGYNGSGNDQELKDQARQYAQDLGYRVVSV